MKKIIVWEVLDNAEEVMRVAKKVGMDKIIDSKYKVIKIRSKNKNKHGYKDGEVFIIGNPIILGDKDAKNVWFYFFNARGEWAKTSPVLSVEKTKTGYKFETKNSFYKMDRV